MVIELDGCEPLPSIGNEPEVGGDPFDQTLQPDCHFIVVGASGTVAARCSCWWTGVPPVEGEPVGAIGRYSAKGFDAAGALLEAACTRLAAAGCRRAIGPLDGNTWRSYRLVTEGESAPPFLLEPWTPPAWLQQWCGAGFSPVAEYTSAVNDDLSREDPRVQAAAARLGQAGISIRSLNTTDPEADLKRIHGLCLASFAANFLYAPISEEEFLESNRRLLPIIRPELVLVAEREGRSSPHRARREHNGAELCGFLFAVPDLLQAGRGQPVDTVIVKTVAVRPRVGAAGLGCVLVAHAHRVARELGFRRAIHALMHERNSSRNISRRYAIPFRRYALMGKQLPLASPRR